MTIDHDALKEEPRILIEASLEPLQGSRFQPTGFPNLGAATYEGPDNARYLLVESAQSMANRLETVCWDEGGHDLVAELQGIPYVEAVLPSGVTTNSILEAHRLNSPYIVNSPEFVEIESEIGFEQDEPFDRRKLAAFLFKRDPNSLLHGIFLEKVGGVVRLPRAVSAFIEAKDVREAASGGVKFDRVQPETKESTPYGKAEEGYGNVPYARDEYTAAEITAFFNIDCALIRGYGLGVEAERFLITLALYKIRRFLDTATRLRTACDFDVTRIEVRRPKGFELPTLADLQSAISAAVDGVQERFASPPKLVVNYDKKARKAKK